MRSIEQTPAEAYRHGVLGGRPAKGGDTCLHDGLRARRPELALHEREGGLLWDLGAPGALPSRDQNPDS